MARYLVYLSLLLYTLTGLAQPPVPQLPQTYVDTTFAPPTGARLNAHTEAEFKKALETANPGDIIVLDAGVTYQGNFTLPVKTNPNNKWIYIVSSGLAKLPAPGTRVGAADAANMPKITSSYVTSTIIFPPGANHYRLVGLEVTTASTQGGSSSQ
ncbi:MAG TPA: hypothetical protein VMU45_15655, partial [Candidatus Eisenbacteria bacterium]|nr:hypothetical protein [Candidatus Eisenbacteria bacterium]